MSIARHTSEEDDKIRLLEKERKQFKKEEHFYGYWVLFLFVVFVLVVISVVRCKN